MHTALVGCTGFVGGNLAASHPFDGLYHSENVAQAYGQRPELLLYAGVPAAKYLANKSPDEDWAVCCAALENIRRIAPQQLVLISTVDVYAAPQGVDENTPADVDSPAAYGRNRARLERQVRELCPSALIVRLPGLFGAGLKKNFLYDFITRTPAMLPEERYRALAEQNALVGESYAPAQDGFFALRADADKVALRAWFAQNDFSALSFTDSRAQYQFYDLRWLWKDLSWAMAAKLTLLNLATEPLCAAEIYETLTHGGVFENKLDAPPPAYDMRSKYDTLYEGQGGYLYSSDEVLGALRSFVFAARDVL